jgi:hypothetical protein
MEGPETHGSDGNARLAYSLCLVLLNKIYFKRFFGTLVPNEAN